MHTRRQTLRLAERGPQFSKSCFSLPCLLFIQKFWDQVCWSCVATAGEDSLAACDTLRTSCRRRYTDTAKRTTSFMRKATFPTMAGNPPADGAQPSGIKGMMGIVVINGATDPRAPSIPNFLFQNPPSSNAPNSHSETPRNELAPLNPKTSTIQTIKSP